ncbi:hypothetical protein QN387_26415, partial [Pseudomonas sp. CCI3.1]
NTLAEYGCRFVFFSFKAASLTNRFNKVLLSNKEYSAPQAERRSAIEARRGLQLPVPFRELSQDNVLLPRVEHAPPF